MAGHGNAETQSGFDETSVSNLYANGRGTWSRTKSSTLQEIQTECIELQRPLQRMVILLNNIRLIVQIELEIKSMILLIFRWKFAYTCVLEEEVRRSRRNWDWNNMKLHRDTCRHYAKVYQTKLTSKKVPAGIDEHITECERKLDIFNLVIIRQQIELEVLD